MPGLKTKMKHDRDQCSTDQPRWAERDSLTFGGLRRVLLDWTRRLPNPAASVPSLPERAESQIRGPAIIGDAPQRRA